MNIERLTEDEQRLAIDLAQQCGRGMGYGTAWYSGNICHLDLDVFLKTVEKISFSKRTKPKVDELVRKLVNASKGVPELDDVLDWADGIMGALGTEFAERVTPLELRIANAIMVENRKYLEENHD